MYNIFNITNTAYMFAYSNMTSLNTNGWEYLKTNDCSSMFYNCYNLVDINCSNWKFINIDPLYLSFMFGYCNNLSDNSINSIIDMIINISFNFNNSFNIYSIFMGSNITNDRYQNRWTELDALNIKY